MSRPAPSRSSMPHRLLLWLAVCAMLLKAAVPLLASASAEMQGKALVEVCTSYGVATVSLDDGTPATPDHPLPHAGDHCVLGALVAFGATGPVIATLPPADTRRVDVAPVPEATAFDADAAWIARLKHGPPLFA